MRTADAGRAGLVAATRTKYLPIPGTSSLVHLRENLAEAALALPPEVIKDWTRGPLHHRQLR